MFDFIPDKIEQTRRYIKLDCPALQYQFLSSF